MIVGVEHMDLPLLIQPVLVQILPGVDQPAGATGDLSVFHIGLGGIAGGGGAGGADVHLVILQVAAAAGNIGQLRLVGILIGISL